MVQKADLPNSGSNKRKFRRDSMGRERQPTEKKSKTRKAYVVTPTTTTEATTPRSYMGNSPK